MLQLSRVSASVENSIAKYYDTIAAAVPAEQQHSDPARFTPGWALPELTDWMRSFFSVSGLRMIETSYRDHQIKILDLTGNPRTRTTKTNASLIIVARALRYIHETGERVMIITPTSGNKGTALRDAVLRALEHRLAEPDKLMVTTVAPHSSSAKLWMSDLATDPELRRRNPLLLYQGDEPENVKPLVRDAVDAIALRLHQAYGVHIWPSLSLENYCQADSVRACFELDCFPPAPGQVRVHAHAVSSAFGLLGYHMGLEILSRTAPSGTQYHPQFLLVQHLATPDMVLSLRHNTFSRSEMPRYQLNEVTGLYEQHEDPAFPFAAEQLTEQIDPTFYSRKPVTSEAINPIIRQYGGGGIVVSRAECLDYYSKMQLMLQGSGLELPDSPDQLREWSLVMVLCGVMKAIDRDMTPPGSEVVVHASGLYSAGDFEPFDTNMGTGIATSEDVCRSLERAIVT
jgi:hypothetical protein